MGGHGGLNILPQKRWNVYNFENREKVRKDEEAAAREEEVKREESRKRDSELRLQQLRQARGVGASIAPASAPATATATAVAAVAAIAVGQESNPVVESESELDSKSNSKHINLFEGIKIFDPVEVKKVGREDEGDEKKKKKMKKEEVRVVGPEDEKYRLGYGVAGKGVKAPWYATRPAKDYVDLEREQKERECFSKTTTTTTTTTRKKKTVEELREERLKREKAEKERARALLLHKHNPR